MKFAAELLIQLKQQATWESDPRLLIINQYILLNLNTNNYINIITS